MIRFDLEIDRGGFELRAAMATSSRVSGLFGPSGSGKTTLLLALAGLLTPSRGFIEVDGEVLYDSSRGRRLPPERRRVGMVFQEDRLLPHLTVRDNLRFSRPGPGGPVLEEIVELLDLEPLLDRGVHKLSGGQRRLVAVGRALLAAPRLLLLDEPMTGLDPGLRRRVLAHLLRLKDSLDVRMFLVSHVYADFLALVDETGLLNRGRLTAVGPPLDQMAAALGTPGSGPVASTLPGKVLSVSGLQATVDCGGARLQLGLPGSKPGDETYVTVNAQDVLVAVGPPPLTSARNTLPGRVVDVRRGGDHVLVEVDVGPRIWTEITETSLNALGLEPGSEVHLLIKASALRGVALPPTGAMRTEPGLR